MDLNDVAANVADQEKGRWFEILDPVKGAATGIRFRVAGPDSGTQRRAELKLADDLAEMADPDGRVSAEARDKARINCLAACVLDWQLEEDGQPIPFNTANVVRVLRLARWIEAQVDGFASERAGFEGAE
ncbi:MAG: hypothetical protein JJU15_00395 [Pararhodobacter sp.]|nr:hypothetical protein [Pararhodobacter sp.]